MKNFQQPPRHWCGIIQNISTNFHMQQIKVHKHSGTKQQLKHNWKHE